MKKSILFLLFVLPSALTLASDLPSGFTQKVLNQVLNGKIVAKVVKDKGKVLHKFMYAYLDLASAQLFVDLATDHETYADMFAEVTSAKTTWNNKERDRFRYILKLKLYGQKIDALMYQTIDMPTDTEAPTIIANFLTNNKSTIKRGEQETRLYPYKGGFLIREELFIVTTSGGFSGWFIKRELNKFFSQYVAKFRAQLNE